MKRLFMKVFSAVLVICLSLAILPMALMEETPEQQLENVNEVTGTGVGEALESDNSEQPEDEILIETTDPEIKEIETELEFDSSDQSFIEDGEDSEDGEPQKENNGELAGQEKSIDDEAAKVSEDQKTEEEPVGNEKAKEEPHEPDGAEKSEEALKNENPENQPEGKTEEDSEVEVGSNAGEEYYEVIDDQAECLTNEAEFINEDVVLDEGESSEEAKLMESEGMLASQAATYVYLPSVLAVGDTYDLNNCVLVTGYAPSDAASWKSSKRKIVSISKDGRLTALRRGKAKITVKTRDNKKHKISVSVNTNAINGLFPKPTKADAVALGDAFSIMPKSMKHAGKKIELSFYLLNGSTQRIKYLRDLNLEVYLGSRDKKYASRNFSRIKVNGRKKSVSTFKVSIPVGDVLMNNVHFADYTADKFYFSLDTKHFYATAGKKSVPFVETVIPNLPEEAPVTRVDSGYQGVTVVTAEASIIASFKQPKKVLTLGETWLVEGTVTATNCTIGRVTVNAFGYPDSKLPNGEVRNSNEATEPSENFTGQNRTRVNLQEWFGFTLNTNKAPFNQAGTYKLQIWAKDSNGNGGDAPLATMEVEVVDSSSGITVSSSKDMSRATAENMIVKSENLNWNTKGKIRYVCQSPAEWSNYHTYTSYWISGENFGGECTRASSSMAASYLGLDVLPKVSQSKSNSMQKWYEYWLANYGKVYGRIFNMGNSGKGDCSVTTFQEMYNRYANDQSYIYAPPILYTRYGSNAGFHAIVIIGRDKSNPNVFLAVDPVHIHSQNSSFISKVTLTVVDGEIRISLMDGSNSTWYGPNCGKDWQMWSIVQYYKG